MMCSPSEVGTTMADEDGEHVIRQHVRKMLLKLRTLKDRQRAREKPNPDGSDSAVEVEREEDTPSSIGSLKRPF